MLGFSLPSLLGAIERASLKCVQHHAYLRHQPHDYILNSLLPTGDHRSFVHRPLILSTCAILTGFAASIQTSWVDCIRLRQKQTKHLWIMPLGIQKSFFEINHPKRTPTHRNPAKGSAAKRIHMFLRWMVRQDNNGVDFGLWTDIPTSKLSCPLDIHTGSIARKLGLLKRKQNDQKAVRELDEKLRILDPKDPVKYDFALFGLGVFEKF
ncbi:MAG: hypothetical protein CM15mP83_9420 [Flavobacteriaceae bacterium]|nr:MAG: hypothetical protein CM15mP83_9420 [Flavobacteriaceae bacterium]